MITKEIVVETWLCRGLEQIHLAFDLGEGPWQHYEPFFDYMAVEIFCKAYILAKRSSEYEDLKDDMAIKTKVNKITKCCSHNLSEMLNELNESIGDNKVNHVLSADFDSFTGRQIIEVLEGGYIECRYPVPQSISQKFPIEGTDMHWDPLFSSGLEKFVRAIGREVLISLKTKSNVGIPRSYIDQTVLNKRSGERFCRLFFEDNIDKYTIIEK